MVIFFVWCDIFVCKSIGDYITKRLTENIKIIDDTYLKDPNSSGFSDKMIVILLINLFWTKSVFKH
jgi:hypothetical protein